MSDRNVTTSLLRLLTFFLAASFLLMAQSSTARADHASCMEKAKSYFAEIVELLSKEKNWIVPYEELNKRYEPLEGFDADLLLQEASQTRFIQAIEYNPRAKYFLVKFASNDVKVVFAYSVKDSRSRTHSAGWVNK